MAGVRKYDPNFLMAFARTDTQREHLQAVIDCGMNNRAAGRKLGINHRGIARTLETLARRAAKEGVAPDQNVNHPTMPGFSTKRVSTAYNGDGDTVLQWHIQEPEKKSLEEIVEGIQEAFTDIKPAKPIKAPAKVNSDLAAFYLIGDHHFGMYAWSEETGGDDYDTAEAERLLISACQKLIARAPDAEVGYLVNLGDFLHANDSTSTTPFSKNLLDTDGRMGRVGRQAGLLIKSLVELMLHKHQRVEVINSRGNHDPDASLWLNEVCRAYFAKEPRVKVHDNFNKFVWVRFGTNLVVTHHGDKINWARMYEAVTRNLSKEWGECEHRFGWVGHLHHEESKELGGMRFQRWGVLAPNDAWHAGSGYGSERTMSCVVLHKTKGRDSIIEVNAKDSDDSH